MLLLLLYILFIIILNWFQFFPIIVYFLFSTIERIIYISRFRNLFNIYSIMRFINNRHIYTTSVLLITIIIFGLFFLIFLLKTKLLLFFHIFLIFLSLTNTTHPYKTAKYNSSRTACYYNISH